MSKIKSFSILTLILIIISGAISLYTIFRVKHLNNANSLTSQMVDYTNDIHIMSLENEIAILSYATTYDSIFLDSINMIQGNISKKLDTLREFNNSLGYNTDLLNSLESSIKERNEVFEKSHRENLDYDSFLQNVRENRYKNFLKFGQRIKGLNHLILDEQQASFNQKERGLLNNLNILTFIVLAVTGISILAVIISFKAFYAYKKEQEESSRQLADYKEQLENQVSQLNITNKELEQFAYVASHDLQEPLRKITSFNDLLQEQYSEDLEGDGKLYLDRIAFAANRMRKLITDLLEYSRAGRQKEEEVILDLEEVVNEVVDDLYVIVKEKKAVIEIDQLPKILGTYIDWRTVFQNLISNAIKFAKKDTPPHILISSKVADEALIKTKINEPDMEIDYFHLTISDNGIGFNPEYAEKIFIIFQRLFGKDIYEGTGIGLAICKKIFEKMGGIIYAESIEGEGATFHMIFPDYQK
ncbi:ATP-binding protein [Belliella sp. DSM 107340]|uniref:histidine kinase n=1 Tax=Belliella calami TaxID=2923436 RepID=A0ABS9UNI0_9BACT|nr:ATP-binding protein [Belliella calami]MCH7398180.1 ATP-binding protein [Belliella calami]